MTVMWCLEALLCFEAASGQTFQCLSLGIEPCCLGLGLSLDI